MPSVDERAEEETHYPLELLQCQTCTLVQLSCVVDPKVIFYPGYPYSTGNTGALRENFKQLAEEVRGLVDLGSEELVVDIGSNDGTLLSNFGNVNVLGWEPTNQAKLAQSRMVPTRQAFFSANEARRHKGQAKVVTACNVMAHVENIHDVLDGVYDLLVDDGVFVTENHYLGSVIDGMQWDTIYHEHLRYYSRTSLLSLLEAHGLHAFKEKKIPSHGGSFRVYASKQHRSLERDWPGRGELYWPEDRGVAGFAKGVAESKNAILSLLVNAGGRTVGIGAAARGATLLNYCGIDRGMVEAIVEVTGSDKIGQYMPGTQIPVIDEAMLYEQQPENVLVLSHHLANGLIQKIASKGYKGKFILPLVIPKVVTAEEWIAYVNYRS